METHNNGPNYRNLTGIETLTEFESSQDVHTDFRKLCHKGRVSSGLVEMVTSTILDLEHVCQDLSPWDRTDMSREVWIGNIESIAKSYENGTSIVLGPKSRTSCVDSPSPSKRLRRSLDSATTPRESLSSSTLSQVINVLKVSKRIH